MNPKTMREWECPKCGYRMWQPKGVKSVSHQCPKAGVLKAIALERVYTASS